jgi:alanine racemase
MTALVRFEAWLYQFSDDDQEAIIHYALDHLVPRMKKLAASQQPARKALTKTVIGNYLRRALHGDSEMYRNGFKDGARFAEQAHGIPGSEG